MKRLVIVGMAFLVVLGCFNALAKKKKKVKAEAEQTVQPSPLPACNFSKIVISPDFVNDPSVYIGSNKEIYFEATAYDDEGKEVPVHLQWYFRGLPLGEKLTVVAGHKIVGADSKGVFIASGLASGAFRIAAEAVDCVDKYGRHPRGVAKVIVYPNPNEVAICGPILVKYGEREITNETVLGFINFILQANVYGPENLKGYKVRFYLNNRRVKPDRKLIYDRKMEPQFDQPAGYWAWVPVWLAPGDYSAYYVLLKDGEPVCSSTTTYFTAR